MEGRHSTQDRPILTPPPRSKASTTTGPVAVPPFRVEGALLHLERQRRPRDVIRLGELWAEQGEPTVPARLAHARALLSLCLVDRAWAKLRELHEKGEGGLETTLLIVRMFLDRGWPHQARKPLEAALTAHPEHPELNQLWSRLSDTIMPPEADDGDSLGPELQLRLAERHLLFNNLTRARVLLERLRRGKPDHVRVGDLLWAMDGNFRADTDHLATLVERWAPDPLAAIGDLPEDGEHTDSTESVTAAELHGMTAVEQDARNFPQLFRGLEPLTELGREREKDEVTAVTSLAALEALRVPAGEWTTEPGDDTQIVRVVSRPQTGAGNGAEPDARRGPPRSDMDAPAPAAPASRPLSPAPSAAVTAPSYDLAALQREARSLPVRSDLGPEREDEDVVVVKHRQAASSERETIPAPPERADMPDEVGAWARKGGQPSAAPKPSSPVAAPRPAAPDPKPPMPWQWWLVPVAGLGLLGLLLLLAVAASQILLGVLS